MANIGFKNKMIGKVKMNFINKNDYCLASIAESKHYQLKIPLAAK